MKKQHIRKSKKRNLRKSPVFLIALFNFLIIIAILIYIIYLRFIPYQTILYDGYAVTGNDLASNLLNASFDVDQSVAAIEVKDQDEIFKNLKSFYIGAAKKKQINLNYPIYVNDALALYNLSSEVDLITDNLRTMEGYSGFTLSAGALYNANTLERADYFDYILMKNADGMYINTKDIKIETIYNKYTIKMNSIVNFTDEFITYYTLKDGNFIYHKILDVDMNSKVKIKAFNKEYTYKEFLIGLNIIKEETKTEENIVEEENIIEEPKQEVEENVVQAPEENKIGENTIGNEGDIIEGEGNGEGEGKGTEGEGNTDSTPSKWQKPKVTCTEFVANTYSVATKVSIYDPSGAIYKAVTFSFYVDNEIQMRSSTKNSGDLKVKKLLPNTTYHVVGTFQYITEKKKIVEVKFTEQDFTTLGTEYLNAIDLSFENGQIYSDKIELKDLTIVSNLEDEAISGVFKAEINMDGNVYPINTAELRKILKGEKIKHQFGDGIDSDSEYKYEIKFYDTAKNEMKLTNNTGNSHTAKVEPSVRVRVNNSEVISVTLDLTLSNDDKVDMKNYRYELYSSNGKRIKNEKLSIEERNSIFLDTLNPNDTYNIIVYADFDANDNKGHIKNREIGNATFNTLKLSALGSVQLNVDKTNVESNKIELDVVLNNRTDKRLLKVLKEIKIEIKDINGKGKEFFIKDFEKFAIEESGLHYIADELNSNTRYYINITSIAKQGDYEEEIRTTYTLKNVTTRKLPAKYHITNTVVTYNLIDFDIYFEDVDGAASKKEFIINLREHSGYKVDSKIVKANEKVRCVFNNLSKDTLYILECFADDYSETEDEEKKYQPIGKTLEFETNKLGGSVDLISLIREEKEENKNLIDVISNNKWYSKTFGVLKNNYVENEFGVNELVIESIRNYGKTYNNETKELTLTANQCYVYDFNEVIKKYKDYKDESGNIPNGITLYFEVTETNYSKIYIQKGKSIGNKTEIQPYDSERNLYSFAITFSELLSYDGYLGFYIEQEKKYEVDEETGEQKEVDVTGTVKIKNLQARLSNDENNYEDFQYYLESTVGINFKDALNITNNDEQWKYYVRIYQNNDLYMYEEDGKEKKAVFEYLVNANKHDKEEFGKYIYNIIENKRNLTYKIELYIVINEREYILDDLTFDCIPTNTTIKDEKGNENLIVNEIKTISNISEYKEIQPYGRYRISNNIDLSREEEPSENTFGNPNIGFYGMIDFNGKTITKDTLIDSGLKRYKNTSYLFYDIKEDATIKNLVLNLNINNYIMNQEDENEEDLYLKDEKDGFYGVFLYNHGNINNLMVNLIGSTDMAKRYIGLIGYENSGTIDRFIINLKTTLYGRQYVSGGCLYSYGIMKNGYMYDGSETGIGRIEVNSYITQGEDSSRNIGGFVYELKSGGKLQRVYNLTGIKIDHYNKTNSYGANIVYKVNSGAEVSGVYTTESITTLLNTQYYNSLMDYNGTLIYNGPNIIESSGNITNSYYFDQQYENNQNEYSIKEQISKLSSATFQENLLNSDLSFKAFNVNKSIQNGCFPELILNSCMPKQPKNKISDKDSSDLDSGNYEIDLLDVYQVVDDDTENIDKTSEKRFSDLLNNEKEDYQKQIISNLTNEMKNKAEKIKEYKKYEKIEDIWNIDNCYLFYFEVYNPGKINITEVNIENIESKIIFQRKEENNAITGVYVLLTCPEKYLNNYKIVSIKAEALGGTEYEDKNIEKVLNIPCYKYIYDTSDWDWIYKSDKGCEENYKIATEKLDFGNYVFWETVDFNGTIGFAEGITNCEFINMTLSYGSLFNSFKSDIRNITFKDIKIETKPSKYTGIIGEMLGSASDITIENLTIICNSPAAERYIGGLCGKNTNREINNINVKNVQINMNEERNEDSRYYIGGICGKSEKSINNSQVTGDEFSIKFEQPIKGSLYAGGICGTVSGDINNVSVSNLKIEATDNLTFDGKYYIGGLVGSTRNRINNSNVENLKISNINNEGKNENAVGGIVGIINEDGGVVTTEIKDSSITRFELMNTRAKGIGGILGINNSKTDSENLYTNPNSLKISECYTKDMIVTNNNDSSGIGGVIGVSNGNYQEFDSSTNSYKYGYSNIEKCFVQGFDITNNSDYVDGIGGIIGSSKQIVNIISCYTGHTGTVINQDTEDGTKTIMSTKTRGWIKTNSKKAGGIAGELVDLSNVKYCYSLLDIEFTNENLDNDLKEEYLGGIIGKYSNNSEKNISENINNNLFAGNIIIPNKYIGNTFNLQNTKRIVGNNATTVNSINYAYEEQIIGNAKTDLPLGAKILKVKDSNENTNLKYLFDNNLYDFIDADDDDKDDNGSMDLYRNGYEKYIDKDNNLLYLDSKKFPKLTSNLDKQNDNTLGSYTAIWDYGIEVISRSYKYVDMSGYEGTYSDELKFTDKSKDKSGNSINMNNGVELKSVLDDGIKVKITLKLQNKGKSTVKNVGIRNDDLKVESIEMNENRDEVYIYATPERYLTTYIIDRIYYSRVDENGNEVDNTPIEKKLDIPQYIYSRFYRVINDVDDWKNKMTQYKENYILTNDINISVSDYAAISEKKPLIYEFLGYNHTISGEKPVEGNESEFIKNGLINQVDYLNNTNFNNFTVKGNSLIYSVGGGEFSNCKFFNITVNGENRTYSAIVSTCTSSKVKEIELNNIIVNGKNQSAGFIGNYNKSTGEIYNIIGNNIIVNAPEGDVVGGLIGFVEKAKVIGMVDDIEVITDLSIDNSTVTGFNNVGGCIGKTSFVEKGVEKLTSNNCTIDQLGETTAGGCIGENRARIKNINSNGNIVNGTKCVGGNIGLNMGNAEDLSNTNGTVTGIGENVGGNIGQNDTVSSKAKNLTSRDIEVTSTGGNVGGNIGCSNAVSENLEFISENKINNTIIGTNYVGGNIGYSANNANNLSIEGTNIKAGGIYDENNNEIFGSYVGGNIGYAKGTNNTLKFNIDGSTTVYIDGLDYVGGNIGFADKSGSLETLTIENTKICTKDEVMYKSKNIGGNVGKTQVKVKTLTSTNIEVRGLDYIGGNIGYSNIGTNDISDILTTSASNIVTSGSYVGGNIGYIENGIYSNLNSKNNEINAYLDCVGGCVGISKGRIRKAQSTNTTILGNNNVGGIVGQELYCSSSSNTLVFSINGAYVSGATVTGKNNVGGVAGESLGTVYAVVVDNSNITAQIAGVNEEGMVIGGSNAGGILGYYKPYQGSLSSNYNEKSMYFLSHSLCTNSKIDARENAGGLIGNFVFGYIQYCYAGNNKINSKNLNELGNNAGGLVGLLNNSQMNETQYIAQIRYCMVVNSIGSDNMVYGNEGVGGLIGKANKKMLEGYITNSLIATNIKATYNYSIGIGKIEENAEISENIDGYLHGTFSELDNIYIYENCYKKNTDKDENIVDSEYKNKVSIDELKTEYIYSIDKIGLLSTGRYTTKDIYDNGFLNKYPYLIEPVQTSGLGKIWGAMDILSKIPKISIEDENQVIANLNLSKTMSARNDLLPEIYVYPVGINKLNIEFSHIDSSTEFEIKTADGNFIDKTIANEMVYTYEYDFNTDFTITVSNFGKWYEQEISAESVRNKLDIQNDEYIYLKDNTIQTNKRTLEGEYVNLYNGQILSKDGKIYDIYNMNFVEDIDDKLELLETNIPIIEYEYEGSKIQTFYHCTKVINGEQYDYKKQQIFMKNDSMYLVDGEFEGIGDSIIIDSFNNKQYETVLGNDGIIYDLLTEIKYPSGFKNEKIIDMTNNINDNGNIVLVYYENGKVLGFNYITGQEVYNNGVEEENIGLMTYMMGNLRANTLLYNIEKESYEDAQKLAEKLEHTSIEQALSQIGIENDQDNSSLNIDSNTNTDNTDEDIDVGQTMGENNENNSTNKNNSVEPQYITTYNTTTQKYVVYSTTELLNTSKETKTENEKIEQNEELTSFYDNLSVSKVNIKQIGIILFISAITLICVTLVIMYKKNLRKIGK